MSLILRREPVLTQCRIHYLSRGGIGQATARAFARAGCSIAVHHSSAKSKAKADNLVAELVKLAPGIRAATFEADLSTYENARKLCDEVVEGLGHPDILFSNHGVTGTKIGPLGDMQEVSAETFEETWRTNAGTGYVVRTTFVIHQVTFHPFVPDWLTFASNHCGDPARTKMCTIHAREEVGTYRLQFKVRGALWK